MPQRIVFPAKGQVQLQNFTLPACGPQEVQVQTLASLISIGTETIILHQNYAPDSHFDRIFGFPQLKTGVQAVAIVEQCGAEVTEFAPGDRIFMRMAHGSHQVLPATACSPVPGGVDSQDACWAGLAKTAFRAAHAGNFKQAASVLIIGAGPVGQMALRWATAMGVAERVMVDLSATRLNHARDGGATTTLLGAIEAQSASIAQLNQGSGPPIVVDTTGNAEVFKMALAVAGRFGHVILLGDSGFPERQCLTSDMMTKGLTVQATHDSHDRDGWNQRRIDERFFATVEEGKFALDGLITHRFAPAQCVEAYALASTHRDHAVGIIFDWTA